MCQGIWYRHAVLLVQFLDNYGYFQTVLELVCEFLFNEERVVLQFLYVGFILLGEDSHRSEPSMSDGLYLERHESLFLV
jgi:hypothetical protein